MNKSDSSLPDVDVVIPTYGRDRVLVETIEAILECRPSPASVLVVDQSRDHDAATRDTLEHWARQGRIRHIRLTVASQPHAMNVGLREAQSPLVLFLDDDVVPVAGLVGEHAAGHADLGVWAIVGQVLQPGEEPRDAGPPLTRDGLRADLDFPFYSTRPTSVSNVMSGNLSVKRERALAIGGFDENFHGVAYRFDTEFGRRLLGAGGRIEFLPTASIRHLRAARGGTRSTGSHLTSADPRHGVGDYYFAARHGRPTEAAAYMARRMVREVATRFHRSHPWWIPVKLTGELRACAWAIRMAFQGPRLLATDPGSDNS